MKWIIAIAGYICLASPSVARDPMQQQLPPPPDLPSMTYSGVHHILSVKAQEGTANLVLFESNEGTVVAIPKAVKLPAEWLEAATTVQITDAQYRYWHFKNWTLDEAITRLHEE